MWSVPTRQRTLSGRISSAARRHSTAARPSQSDASPLAQSAAHRPPNPDNKPSAHPCKFPPNRGGDSRYRWLGRFVLVHSRPAAALLLVLRARPDLLLNRFQRPRCLLELDPARNQRQRSAEPEPEPGLGGDGPALADGARGSLRDELGRLGSPVPNAELPHLLDEVAVLRGAPASGVDIAGRGAAAERAAERAAVRAAQRWGAGAPPAVRASRMVSQTGPVQHSSLRGWRGTRLPGSFWPSKTSYSGCSFR